MIFENNMFFWKDKKYVLNDLMDVDFYQFSDSIADEYKFDSYVENELFYTFIQQIYALKRFMAANEVKEIQITSGSYGSLCLVLSAAAMEKIPINISLELRCKKLYSLVKAGFFFAASLFYMAAKIIPLKFSGSPDCSHDVFSIVRLNQEYQKYEFFRENTDILFDYENIKSTLASNKEAVKAGLVYNRFSRSVRLKWAVKATCNAFRELKKIHCFLERKLSKSAGEAALLFYSKRMIHTCYYAEMIDHYFSLFPGKQYLTGKIIDRYGLIESKFAKKYNIHVVNYPHGIEYGFKVPFGLVGDEFYATSGYAAAYFCQLYKTDKFKFDQKIMDVMLNRHGKSGNSHDVVFFSEAHEVEINLAIIEGLISMLFHHHITLYLKPHPREDMEVYKKFRKKIKIVTNFSEAITGNICIARRSTILVEALYNGSKPLAIVIDTNDFAIYKNYPSLQDSAIRKFDSVEKLSNHVIKSWREWNEGTD